MHRGEKTQIRLKIRGEEGRDYFLESLAYASEDALEPTSPAEYVWQWLYTYGGGKWMITDSHFTEEEAEKQVVAAYIHTLRKVHESKMDRSAYSYYKTKRAENDRFR